jgi:hypothetical protein
MAWDSTRPVPWQRLIREWLIYAAIMTVVFLVFFRDGSAAGAIAGVLISGPLYLAFGAILAKFGYQRQRLQRPSAATGKAAGDSTAAAAPRPKPAPTSRTSGTTNRPKSSKR